MADDFQIKLRQEMDRRGLTVYRFARLIDPDNPWVAERNLYRWLSEKQPRRPSAASLRSLAGALGVEPDFFVPTETEAERDERLMREVVEGALRHWQLGASAA